MLALGTQMLLCMNKECSGSENIFFFLKGKLFFTVQLSLTLSKIVIVKTDLGKPQKKLFFSMAVSLRRGPGG